MGRDVWTELEGLQAQLAVLQASLGLLVGALRAVGVIGVDTEQAFFALVQAGGPYAPTISRAEWNAAAGLGRHFAQAVTLDEGGSLALRP